MEIGEGIIVAVVNPEGKKVIDVSHEDLSNGYDPRNFFGIVRERCEGGVYKVDCGPLGIRYLSEETLIPLTKIRVEDLGLSSEEILQNYCPKLIAILAKRILF